MKRFIAPLLAIVLLGAGCSQTVTSDEAKAETKPAVTSTTEKKPEIAKVENTGEVRELVAAQTDDTWKTYTSKSLGFSFQWPTRGRYAPQWEVKMYPISDANFQDGCFVNEGTRAHPTEYVAIQNKRFCHVSTMKNGAELNGATEEFMMDSYATQIDKTLVVIHFNKKIYLVDNCPPGAREDSVVPNACVLFGQVGYWQALDSIVGTFKLNQ